MVKEHFKSILTLAVIFLLLAPTMLMIERSQTEVEIVAIAQQLIVLSVIYFAFTTFELIIVGMFRQKDPSYFIGVNLAFSLFRLLLTVGILLYLKFQTEFDFTLSFINILVFYFATLLFSTWRRQRENSPNANAQP